MPKVLYFKATYDPKIETSYYRNFYGHTDFAPAAEVLIYNDDEGFCIGFLWESIHDFRKRMITEYWNRHKEAGTEPPVKYDIDNYDLPEHFEYISEEEALKYYNEVDIRNPKVYKGDSLKFRWFEVGEQ